MLRGLVYIDLVGRGAADARQKLLADIRQSTGTPFPGQQAAPFPGQSAPATVHHNLPLPNHQLIAWLHAEEPATLAQEYAALAGTLGLPEAHLTNQQAQTQAVHRWLAQHGNWLLVFDNAETAKSIEPYLPIGATGHISIAYIQEALPNAREQACDRLAALLGDLPLALAQVVAYIDQNPMPLTKYCDLFTQQKQVMMQKGSPPDRDETTIATIWEVALQRLSTDAIQVLTLASYLAPDTIPKDLLQAWLDETEAARLGQWQHYGCQRRSAP